MAKATAVHNANCPSVGKPSTIGQPTRPTQPYPFGVEKLSSEQLYQMCAGRAIW